jgi:hypothetical protein
LARNAARDRTVDRQQCCAGIPGKKGSQLRNDVGLAGDISGVVEDRVSEKNDVRVRVVHRGIN